MYKIVTLVLVGSALAVASFAAPATAVAPKAVPEIDLATGGAAVTLLGGAFLWMRYRRKRQSSK